MDDLGTPIVCAHYDLEDALLRENAAQLEDVPPLSAVHSTSPSMNKQPTPPSTMPLRGLTKKKGRQPTQSSAINANGHSCLSVEHHAPQPLLLEFWRRPAQAETHSH
ncbi:hypothetical protein B0H14DRAFT_3441074 [Mycena olivaceomarginata]|nr:hypothetical protein B0H14DRAFT_3441074 [Mycena olivaceomarginata]